MTAFELFGVLKLDKRDFDAGLKDAEKSGSSFGAKLGGGLASAAKIGIAGIGAATTAVVGFGKSSISAATSFESAFTGVRKTVDATEEEYGQLSDWIMEASTKMASSKEDIAATMEIAGQLGVRGVDGLQKFTETMVMLGDTTNLSAEEAASALAKFGNIAGLESTDMDRIGSAIVDLGNHFATTEADITAMATRLASAGTIAGLSATDILGLSTAMSSVGIQAEAGGTAMAQTMASMTKAVEGAIPYLSQPFEALDDDAKEAMESLLQYADVSGMTAQEFAEAWKGEPIKAIQAFIGGLGEMNEADQSVVMMLDEMGLKGIRQSNMLQALALASDTMTDAVNTANTAFEENVALQNEANTRYGTTESQMLQAAEAFKNLKVVVGQELMPTMQQFTGFTTTAMQDISKGLQEGGLEGMMSSMGVAISDGLAMVTEMIPTAFDAGTQLLGALGQGIIDNLPQVVDAAVQIAVKLSAGLVQALPELAKGAVTLVKSLGESLSKNSEALMSAGADLVKLLWNGITEGLPMLAQGAIELMGNFAEYLQTAIPELLPVALNALMEFSGSLRENAGLLVDGALNLIMTLAQGLIDSLPAMIQTIPTIVSNIAGIINDNAPKLIATGIELIGKLVIGIVEAIPTLIAEFPKIIQAIFDVIMAVNWLQLGSSIITGIGNGVKALAQDLPTTLKNIGTQAVEWLKTIQWSTLGRDIIDLIVIGVKALITAIPNLLKTIGRNALAAFKSIDWISVGKFLVTGIVSGIGKAAHLFYEAIANLAKKAWESITDFFKVESPSKRMMWVGEMLDEGLAKGISNMAYMVDDAMQDLSAGVMELTPQLALADGGNLAGVDGMGYNQVVNIYSPTALDPSETARQTRNATRDMVLELRGKR